MSAPLDSLPLKSIGTLSANSGPPRVFRDGEPCSHPGCLSHVSHPCEGCGRIGGRSAAPKPILIGEANPYGSDPSYALYPMPENSAGGRLCRIVMGLEMTDYLRRFDRRNLCPRAWSLKKARAVAAAIREEIEYRAEKEPQGQHRGVAVFLGAKVCAAFGVEFRPFTVMAMVGCWRAVILPHPSGLSRLWNEPGAVEKAREALVHVGVLTEAEART